MPTLGLDVIARGSAATLALCLGSVHTIVEKAVIAGKGLVDATAAIARLLKATVMGCSWCGNVAAARTAALAGSTTDWILVLDADAYQWHGRELKQPAAAGYVTPSRDDLKPWDKPLTGMHKQQGARTPGCSREQLVSFSLLQVLSLILIRAVWVF